MLVALRMPAGGRRSGLVPSAVECKQDWCLEIQCIYISIFLKALATCQNQD